MEGPTPVSALIHAATMVAAGVYLVGRIFPILTADAHLFIAIIGATTLTMAALIAIAQSDIKKVLAYSTLSQLGYMILAMGVGSWIGGLFHLITHAFFKALLFLGSGSVINAAHHEQELPQYGGLWRKIPVTAITFGIAVLAIAGVPFLSGYYSKDMILTHAGAFAEIGKRYYWLFFILPTAIAYVTAFYMTRCWMLTFAGKPRNQHLYDHARERGIMYGPLVALAAFAVIAGYPRMTYVRELIESTQKEITAKVRADGGASAAKLTPFAQSWPAKPPEEAGSEEKTTHRLTESQEAHLKGESLVEHIVFWAPWCGILAGILLYARGYKTVNVFMKFRPMQWIHTWLYRRMYFDELYMGVFVAVTLGLSRLAAAIDKYVVDALVNSAANAVRRISFAAGVNDQVVVNGAVNGAAVVAQGMGMAVRAPQTGRIRFYVTIVLCLVAIGAGALVVFVLV